MERLELHSGSVYIVTTLIDLKNNNQRAGCFCVCVWGGGGGDCFATRGVVVGIIFRSHFRLILAVYGCI